MAAVKRCEAPGCGVEFEPRRSTARYHSATCRQRAARDRKAAAESVAADAAAGRAEHPLVTSVRLRLEAAKAVDSVDGQVALQLARRLATPDESGPSSLARELRAVLTAAVGGEEKRTPEEPDESDDVPDQVAEARRLRDAAREAAGRA